MSADLWVSVCCRIERGRQPVLIATTQCRLANRCRAIRSDRWLSSGDGDWPCLDWVGRIWMKQCISMADYRSGVPDRNRRCRRRRHKSRAGSGADRRRHLKLLLSVSSLSSVVSLDISTHSARFYRIQRHCQRHCSWLTPSILFQKRNDGLDSCYLRLTPPLVPDRVRVSQRERERECVCVCVRACVCVCGCVCKWAR